MPSPCLLSITSSERRGERGGGEGSLVEHAEADEESADDKDVVADVAADENDNNGDSEDDEAREEDREDDNDDNRVLEVCCAALTMPRM